MKIDENGIDETDKREREKFEKTREKTEQEGKRAQRQKEECERQLRRYHRAIKKINETTIKELQPPFLIPQNIQNI